MHNKVIFRNDDIRQTLDRSLIEITDLFIDNGIPITHAVEPGNVSLEVVQWLLDYKNKYPDLIEIIQHGYIHALNYQEVIGGKLRKGEFGGKRTLVEQFNDIMAGANLMDKFFGNSWFKAFTFPYGARNDASLLAVDQAGLKVVNGAFSQDLKHKLLYMSGHLMNKRMLFDKRISYNLKKVPGTKLFEIDMNLGFIKKYIDEGNNAEFYAIEEMIEKFRKFENQHAIGILLHHRYHNNTLKIKLIEDFLKYLIKRKKFSFSTQEIIYKEFYK